MGVYRLTIPETIQESLNPNARNGSSSFKSRRQQFLMEDPNSAHPSPKPSRFFEAPLVIPSTTSLEAPELEHFSELDDGSTSSVLSASSTRTSHTISDDDSLLMELASRTSSIDGIFFAPPKRHSTACCADGAFRREQRRRQVREESNVVDEQRDAGLAMSHSFRREFEREDDRVDRSLALWEDTECDRLPRRKVANVHPAPHSWHAGDTSASPGSRRNKKKHSATASFFNGLFSGLNLPTSRRSRKSTS